MTPIELDTPQGKDVYRVERTWVVNPEDVSVLEPTSTRALTLVTCYPFYFVGSAPQRFIVRAVRSRATPRRPRRQPRIALPVLCAEADGLPRRSGLVIVKVRAEHSEMERVL